MLSLLFPPIQLTVPALLPCTVCKITQPCSFHHAFLPLFTTLTSKCLINTSEFVCAMGGDYCCPCFTDGETETDTLSRHHTVGRMVQSELELKTSKTCCHMVRDLERRQVKLRALNTSASTASRVQKPGRHLLAPAANLWPTDRIWFARTSHIYSPALTSPAPTTVRSPSWALRPSVGPADCLCARTALFASGSESQD